MSRRSDWCTVHNGAAQCRHGAGVLTVSFTTHRHGAARCQHGTSKKAIMTDDSYLTADPACRYDFPFDLAYIIFLLKGPIYKGSIRPLRGHF